MVTGTAQFTHTCTSTHTSHYRVQNVMLVAYQAYLQTCVVGPLWRWVQYDTWFLTMQRTHQQKGLTQDTLTDRHCTCRITNTTSKRWHMVTGTAQFTHTCTSTHTLHYRVQNVMLVAYQAYQKGLTQDTLTDRRWLTAVRGCQLSANKPFRLPQLKFGTVCRSMSRLQRHCLSSAAIWRHISLGAATLDCTDHSYCWAWEVTLSLSDTLIILVTYPLTRRQHG